MAIPLRVTELLEKGRTIGPSAGHCHRGAAPEPAGAVTEEGGGWVRVAASAAVPDEGGETDRPGTGGGGG